MNGVIVLILCLLPTAAGADCIELIEFEIEDQFKEKHTHDEILGQTTMFVWADRKGSEYTEAWTEAPDEAFADVAVRSKTVAHVKGVPGWIPGLKGKIRGRFSDDPQEWALMDWDGKFVEAYDITEDTVNVLVFDAGGCMLGRVAGDGPDPVLIEALLEHFP